MAVTRQRKLEVAERSFELLTKKYGMKAEDLYFDPLVFPCASGDAQYTGSGVETIEGVRLIKLKEGETLVGVERVEEPEEGAQMTNRQLDLGVGQAGDAEAGDEGGEELDDFEADDEGAEPDDSGEADDESDE